MCKDTRSSQPTITRAFKKIFATTPGNYIKERRLNKAAIMIEPDEYRIGDICVLVGYEDLGSFSRAFKERFGQLEWPVSAAAMSRRQDGFAGCHSRGYQAVRIWEGDARLAVKRLPR